MLSISPESEHVPQIFKDRTDAGEELAVVVKQHLDEELTPMNRLLVLALPRGGIPVAAPIAEQLGCPMDVFLVRKLGAPGLEEVAIGALAEGGDAIFDEQLVSVSGASEEYLKQVQQKEAQELQRRMQVYRGGRPLPCLKGATVIIVDDGLATGLTMLTACEAVRQLRAERVIVAVPVGVPDTVQRLRQSMQVDTYIDQRLADDVICLSKPPEFKSVGCWYEDFHELDDEEVLRVLEKHSSVEKFSPHAYHEPCHRL